MNNLNKAAAFGAMMGKQAAFTVANPTERRLIGGAAGALVGGLGTAGYDWLRGTKENKLKRALMGAGLGGLTGVGIGQLTNLMDPSGPKAPAPEDQGSADSPMPDAAPAEAPMPDAPPLDGRLVPVKSHFTPEDFKNGFDFNEYNVGQADRRYTKDRDAWEAAMRARSPMFFGRTAAESAYQNADKNLNSALKNWIAQKYPELHGLRKSGPINLGDGTLLNPTSK